MAAAIDPSAHCRAAQTEQKVTWKPIPFAIVKLDDQPPKSWNAYHTEKHHGWILLQLWKRYLLLDLKEDAVYDLDPQKLRAKGEGLEWSGADLPEKPTEIAEWNERDIGLVRRYRFRLGKNGHILELQLPLKPNGQPAY